VNWRVKHGGKVVAKGATETEGNYLPIIHASLTGYAKEELRRHGRLTAYAHVCTYQREPEHFCKGAELLIRR
jgi:hypothetical protein